MKEQIMKYKVYIFVGLVLISSIIISLFDTEEPMIDTNQTDQPIIQEEIKYIYVDVKGQVKNPGVYKVETNTRLYQVIHLAGGFTNEANTLLINLSVTLHDEDIIYIPHIDDDITSIPIDLNPSDDLLDINRASLEQLQTLPGIGPTTAQNIIDYRNEVGYFETIEDIKNVSGIGESTFNNIKDLIKP